MNNDEAKDRMAAEIVRLRTELKHSLSQQSDILTRETDSGVSGGAAAAVKSLPVADPDEDYPAIDSFEGLKRHAQKYGAEGKTVTIDLLHYIRLVEEKDVLQEVRPLMQKQMQEQILPILEEKDKVISFLINVMETNGQAMRILTELLTEKDPDVMRRKLEEVLQLNESNFEFYEQIKARQ